MRKLLYISLIYGSCVWGMYNGESEPYRNPGTDLSEAKGTASSGSSDSSETGERPKTEVDEINESESNLSRSSNPNSSSTSSSETDELLSIVRKDIDLKVFGMDDIIRYLSVYKNKQSISEEDLKNYIDKKRQEFVEKFKITNPTFFDAFSNPENKEKLENFKKTVTLFFAAEHGFFNLTKYLVEQRKLSVNEVDEHGRTPLVYAYKSGNRNIVKYLKEHGADFYGQTPLIHAQESGNGDLVKYLEEHGTDRVSSNGSSEYPENP